MSAKRLSPAEKLKQIPKLPAEAFVPKLDDALQAFGNRLEREWPSALAEPKGSRLLLRTLVLASGNTWRTVRYVCAESPDASRKIEYALALTPLARVILEAVFTVVFLFEDLATRTAWFMKSAWRDVSERCVRLETDYGSDAAWTEWLTEQRNLRDGLAAELGISAKERDDPSQVTKRWPIPSRMITVPKNGAPLLSQERLDRLAYLDQQFYGQFSSSAHLQWSGLARGTAPLLSRERDEDLMAGLVKARSDVFCESTTMLLALLSEIEIELSYGHDTQLRYIWTLLGGLLPYVNDLYERYYQRRFENKKR